MAYHLFYQPRHRHALWPMAILASSLLTPLTAMSAYNQGYAVSDEYRDGVNNHGRLYVHGSLTESPCQLAMDSVNQSVNLGNIETADFKKIGASGKPVAFNIELIDCLDAPSALLNERTDTVAWSTNQTGIKVRFIAPSVPFYPQLVNLNGIQGIGLQLSDDQGNSLPLGQNSEPRLIGAGQDKLNYFLTPVRISERLQPGAYNALISFELIYD